MYSLSQRAAGIYCTSPSSDSSSSPGVLWLGSAPELAGVALPEALRGRLPLPRRPAAARPAATALPARLVAALPAGQESRVLNAGT